MGVNCNYGGLKQGVEADMSEFDPLVKQAVADAVLQRAAGELSTLLKELTAAVSPFPNFMELTSIEAIEVEPFKGANPENGCIVVCPDGELRELVLRMIPGPFDMGGVEQTDEMREVELSPGEYVAYAYAAVQQLTQLIEERRQSTD